MIERWNNDDGSETTVVVDESPRRRLMWRGFAFLGKAIFILLICTLPLALIWTGVVGLFTGELNIWSRTRGIHKLYGNAAIVAAWFYIGFGGGGISYIFRDDVKPIFKWLLWLAAAFCLVAGTYLWIRGS